MTSLGVALIDDVIRGYQIEASVGLMMSLGVVPDLGRVSLIDDVIRGVPESY